MRGNDIPVELVHYFLDGLSGFGSGRKENGITGLTTVNLNGLIWVGMQLAGVNGSSSKGYYEIRLISEILINTLKGGDSVQSLISPHYPLDTGPPSSPLTN